MPEPEPPIVGALEPMSVGAPELMAAGAVELTMVGPLKFGPVGPPANEYPQFPQNCSPAALAVPQFPQMLWDPTCPILYFSRGLYYWEALFRSFHDTSGFVLV